VNRNRDAGMDALLESALRGAAGAESGGCPYASELAAFEEGALTGSEQEAIVAHMASCERCQQTLARMSQIQAPTVARTSAGAARLPRLRPRWLVPPVAAAALALLVYAVVKPGVLPEPPAAQMARLESPVGSGSASHSPATTAAEAPLPSGADRGTVPLLQPEQMAGAATARPAPPGQGRADSTYAAGTAAGGVGAAVPAKEQRFSIAADEAKAAPASAAPPVSAQAPPVVEMQKATVAAVAGNVQRPAKNVRIVAESVKDAAPVPEGISAEGVIVTSTDGVTRWRLGPGGRISRSTDSGATWQGQVSGTALDLLAGSAPGPLTCWAVGRDGTVLVTTDGETWGARHFPERVDLVSVHATDERSATVTARDGRRFTTNDGGLTWTSGLF
jgi:hypothetical protein